MMQVLILNLLAMKKIPYLLLSGLGLLACQESTVPKNDERVIAYKETVTLAESPKATLTFAEVLDSRCPTGAQCVWAGNATVSLALTSGISAGNEPEVVSLCLGDCRTIYATNSVRTADTLNYTLGGQSYRFILKAVNPTPQAGRETPKTEYTIRLGIEKM
jgi:hypothetical protein